MKGLILGGFLVMGLSGIAQTASNYSGVYAIDKSKIDFGKAPQTLLPAQFTVKGEKKHIAITRKMENPMKEILEDMNLDGTPFSRDLESGGKATSSFSWIDGGSFKLNKNWVDKEGKSTMKDEEIWNVEDGGKTLKVTYNVEEANGGKYTIVGYYAKL
jgi:hypothetical protein